MQPDDDKPTGTAEQTNASRSRDLPWLRDFVYVVQVKRFIGKRTGQMLDKEQFTDSWGFVRIEGRKKPVPASSHFLYGGGGRSVNLLTFQPGADQIVQQPDGRIAFNTYRPPIVKATSGSVQPWLDIGAHVIPDERVRQHHLQYFAFSGLYRESADLFIVARDQKA